MDMIAVAGIALIGAAISLLLKQYKPEYAMMVGIAVGILIFIEIFSKGRETFTMISDLLEKTQVPVEYSVILFKSLGICFITQIGADSCRDAGENAIASKVELAGKMAILILAVPMFTNLIEAAVNLMSI